MSRFEQEREQQVTRTAAVVVWAGRQAGRADPAMMKLRFAILLFGLLLIVMSATLNFVGDVFLNPASHIIFSSNAERQPRVIKHEHELGLIREDSLWSPLIGAFLTVKLPTSTDGRPMINENFNIVLTSYMALWPFLKLIIYADEEDCSVIKEFWMASDGEQLQLACKGLGGCINPEFGLPTVDCLFSKAQDDHTAPLLLASNADIVFLPDLIPVAFELVRKSASISVNSETKLPQIQPIMSNLFSIGDYSLEHVLVIGTRWDVKNVTDITWIKAGTELWAPFLRRCETASDGLGMPESPHSNSCNQTSCLQNAQNNGAKHKQSGQLHVTQGIDYFLVDRQFPLIKSPKFPGFLVGRQRWDNWIVRWGEEQGYTVDASKAITALHLEHIVREDPYGGTGNRDCNQTSSSKHCSREYNPNTPMATKFNHKLATTYYQHGDIANAQYVVDCKDNTQISGLYELIKSLKCNPQNQLAPNRGLLVRQRLDKQEFLASAYDWKGVSPWFWEFEDWIKKCYRLPSTASKYNHQGIYFVGEGKVEYSGPTRGRKASLLLDTEEYIDRVVFEFEPANSTVDAEVSYTILVEGKAIEMKKQYGGLSGKQIIHLPKRIYTRHIQLCIENSPQSTLDYGELDVRITQFTAHNCTLPQSP